MELDPNAGGVSEATFNAHTHNYRKITQIGGDSAKNWASPIRVDVIDGQEVNVYDTQDLEGVGVTVSTQPTSTPV